MAQQPLSIRRLKAASLANLLLLLALAFLLQGCAALATPPALTPASLGTSRSAVQQVRAATPQGEVALQCVLSVTPERVTVAGLMPFGGRVFTLDYDGKTLALQPGPFAGQAPPAEQILLALQLALWPTQAWRDGLAASGWTLIEPRTGLRQLLHDGRVAVEARSDGDPWQARTLIINYPLRFSLEILPAPATP